MRIPWLPLVLLALSAAGQAQEKTGQDAGSACDDPRAADRRLLCEHHQEEAVGRQACRALAEQYLRGCGQPLDVARGTLLLREQCERTDEESCERLRTLACGEEADPAGLDASCLSGDGAACAKRVLLDSDGCLPFTDAATASPILERGCELGDDEACRRLALLLCRSDAPLPSLPTRALRSPTSAITSIPLGSPRSFDLLEQCERGVGSACRRVFLNGGVLSYRETAWSCLLLKRACELGDPVGCVREAEIHWKRSGIAPDQDRYQSLLRRAANLLLAQCEANNAYACLYGASLLSQAAQTNKPSPDVDIKEKADGAWLRGVELCRTACNGLDAEACLRLPRLYAAVDVPPWFTQAWSCERALQQQVAGIYDTACSASDVAACEALAGFADTHLKDGARAEDAYKRAAVLGSEKAREWLAARPKEPRGSFLTGVAGLGYGQPFGASGSVGLIVGTKKDDFGHYETLHPSSVGGTGALVALEAGTSGGGLSVGWAAVFAIREVPHDDRRFRWAVSPACVGLVAKATVARGWGTRGSLLTGRTYYGGTLELGLLVRGSIGLLTTFSDPRDTRLFWSIGLGF